MPTTQPNTKTYDTYIRLKQEQEAEHTHQLEDALTNAGYNPVSQHQGFRIPLLAGDETLYIHVQPWSRGYSIYVSPDPTATAHGWRHVPPHLAHMQRPVYTARDVVGAYHVPIKAILYAVDAAASQVSDYIDQIRERSACERT